jgi:hypothetical protein
LLFRFRIVVTVMLVVVINGGEGAEEQAADVGEHGGAAGRDASFGEEIVESAEGVVGERFAEVSCSRRRSVVRAEPGGRIAGEGAVLATGCGAMLTTACAGDGAG